MDKFSTETSMSASSMFSSTLPAEKRALSDVLQNTRRGGNYGSLAKSQVQPTYYICHQVEPGETIQRLSLRYGVTVQEIKRVNKLWSDASLSLLETVHIPVNGSQLLTLRNQYPTLNVIQTSPTTNPTRKSSIQSEQMNSSVRSSDSSNSIIEPNSTTVNFQDYFSKIDEQINLSKKTLQSLDTKQYPKFESSNGHQSDDSTTSSTSRNSATSGRKQGNTLSENNIFVTIATQNSREKHISAALERIQREKDDFDEL